MDTVAANGPERQQKQQNDFSNSRLWGSCKRKTFSFAITLNGYEYGTHSDSWILIQIQRWDYSEGNFSVLIEFPWTIERYFNCIPYMAPLTFKRWWQSWRQCTCKWIGVNTGRQFNFISIFRAKQMIFYFKIFFMTGQLFSFFDFFSVSIANFLRFIPCCVRFAKKSNDDSCNEIKTKKLSGNIGKNKFFSYR